MKTSLNELKLIEDFLLANNKEEDKFLYQAQLILQPDLRESIFWQQKTYDLIHKYARKQLKAEIEQVHNKLFTAPEHRSFKQKIMQFFLK